MNRKKLTALLLSLVMVLSLAACQKGQKQDGGSSSASASASASAESSLGDGSAPSEGDTSTAADLEITFEQVNAAAFAEDDTMLVDCAYVIPTVTMADKAVQETIQKSLDEQVAALLDMRSYYTELSTEEYSTWSTEENEGEYLPYYLYLEAKVARADSKVISVVFNKIMYAHGAHGGSEVWGCNFDAETGEYIHFNDLGEHFRETAEKLALEKADEIAAAAITDGEESPFYPNYEENIRSVVLDGTESLADVFDSFADDVEAPAGFTPTFYFTDTGITFISNEYCLQPYAAGNVELEVPYELFGDALGEEWLPTAL